MMPLLSVDWSMDPAIFRWPLEVRWYGVFFAIAFVFGYQIMQRIYRHEGIADNKLEKLLIYTLIATVVGARLGHILFYGPYWGEDGYFSNPLQILDIRGGGLASHGAAIVIPFVLWYYQRKILPEKPWIWILDRVTITVALAGFFIRMGNLFNHEIMGTVTNGFGFKFLRNDISAQQAGHYTNIDVLEIAENEHVLSSEKAAEAYDLIAENANGAYDYVWEMIPVRIPAQLYEAICYLAIFGLMFFLFWKRGGNKRNGLMFGLFMTLVFTARFIIEFWKEHQSEALSNDSTLTMGQILSIPCVLIGLYFLYYSTKHKNEIGNVKETTTDSSS